MTRLLVLALALAAAAPAPAQSLAERLDLARTATRVKLALAEDAQLRTFDFAPSLSANGVLTVNGRVQTEAQRAQVEEVARGVEGVRAVVNAVTVSAEAGSSPAGVPPAVAPAPVEETGPEEAVVEAAPPAQAPPPEAAPAPRPAPAQPQPTYYTVRRGDTLGAIARQHGTSVRQLQQLNNLRGTNIRAGQRLLVR